MNSIQLLLLASAVKGIIKDACTGIRINDAIIISNAGEISASSDGFYSIDTPLGLSTLIVSADGYQFSSQTFFLSPFSVKTYDFSLIPTTNGTGLIRGLITSRDTGTPLSGVRVEADNGAASFSTKDGTYKLYSSICTTALFASRQGLAAGIEIRINKQGDGDHSQFFNAALWELFQVSSGTAITAMALREP